MKAESARRQSDLPAAKVVDAAQVRRRFREDADDAMTYWLRVGDVTGLGAWNDTLRMVGDFPLTGIGINTFSEAMLDYQTTFLDQHFGEAHNDWLQLAAEGGAPGRHPHPRHPRPHHP